MARRVRVRKYGRCVHRGQGASSRDLPFFRLPEVVEAIAFIATWTLITMLMGMRDVTKAGDKLDSRREQVEGRLRNRLKALAKGKRQ